MKKRPADSDYLKKGSNISWDDCLLHTPGVGTSDYGDNDYLYVGKDYDSGTGGYSIWQTFLTFQLPTIPKTHEIESAAIRLYVADDKTDTDIVVECRLTEKFGDVDASDWDFAAIQTTTYNSQNVKTDGAGNKYFEIPLTAAQYYYIKHPKAIWYGNIYFLLRIDPGSAPTGHEYLKFYSSRYATESLRPYLHVYTKDEKEQILDVLLTRLQAIDEFSGYNTTPKTVARDLVPVFQLNESQFPVLYIYGSEETVEPAGFGSAFSEWKVEIAAAVYARSGMNEALHRLVNDVKRVIEQDVKNSSPLLGLDFVTGLDVTRTQTSADWVADNNRGVAIIEVTVRFKHNLTEG